MATYKSFEELPVWQHARKFAAEADQVIENSVLTKYFKLRDQMLGSSGSVMDNIAEGFDRNGNKELVQFLYYSKGSAAEFKSQLYRALDTKKISESDFKRLKDQAEAIGTELGTFIRFLQNSDIDGSKYKKRA